MTNPNPKSSNVWIPNPQTHLVVQHAIDHTIDIIREFKQYMNNIRTKENLP